MSNPLKVEEFCIVLPMPEQAWICEARQLVNEMHNELLNREMDELVAGQDT